MDIQEEIIEEKRIELIRLIDEQFQNLKELLKLKNGE
jgi:hypothetical protein